MTKTTRKKLILSVVIILGILTVFQIFYHLNIYLEKVTNHKKVTELVNDTLTFEVDALEEEVETINDWIDNKHLFNGDMGRLYERASLIYSQLGEDLSYYRYLGYALYYLENSDEKAYTVNVYLDLANFYINNISYERAEEMVDKAESVIAFENLEDLQVKSYAYRMKGILCMAQEDYESAEIYLNQSLEIANQSYTGIFEAAYVAMAEVQLARVYAKTDQVDQAKEILLKYKDSELLTQEVYRETLLRDFVIPYYQTRCFVAVSGMWDEYDGQHMTAEIEACVDDAKNTIHDYMEVCEQNGYEKQELNTLLVMIEKYPPEDKEVYQIVMDEIETLYSKLFTEQNEDYANIIESQVSDSRQTMEASVQETRSSVMRMQIAVLSILAFGIIVITFIIIINNSQSDGLTKVRSRKLFDTDIGKLKRSLNTYAAIMLDIDDFKSVNDTFGHEAGDRVLVRLGAFLRKENNSSVRAYRYGGEEFILLVDKDEIANVHEIAERIRSAMEQERWDFDANRVITVSIGIAKGEGRDDVVKRADDNLYHSKQNGKNRITEG